MIVLRLKDRIPVKIQDYIFTLRPLNVAEKSSVLAFFADPNDVEQVSKGMMLGLSYAITKIDGLSRWDGEPFEIELDENNKITDECMEEISSIPVRDEMVSALSHLLQNVPGRFPMDDKGKEMKGVEFLLGKPKAAKSKRVKKN